MKKIDFQKNIANLYIEIDEIKTNIKEQQSIKKFEENVYDYSESIPEYEKSFFYTEVKDFLNIISTKKNNLLSKYENFDIEKILEDKAKLYFKYTNEYINTNPDFYDALVTINPVWEVDFINLSKYIDDLKKTHPHIKLVKKQQYANIGTSTVFGTFDLATDMNTAFNISKEIEGNYSAQLQIHFLAIDPSYIPTFKKEELDKINSLTKNKINNYLDFKVIASLSRGFLAPHETPINIMKIFLNDKFEKKINYHYIDSIEGKKVKLTDVAKQFIKDHS